MKKKSNNAIDTLSIALGLSKPPASEMMIVPDNPVENLTVLPPKVTEVDLIPLDDDFKFARDRLKEAIETGTDAIKEATDLAVASQNPEAYTALSGLIKATTAAVDKLMNTHLQKKTVQEPPKGTIQAEAGNQGGNTTRIEGGNNQIVFVGTTAELQKMIEAKKNSGEI